MMAGSAPTTINDGDEIVYIAGLDASNRPVIRPVTVSSQGLTCAGFDPFNLPDGGAGGTDGGGASDGARGN
jgi:hypothetical protein